MRERERGKKSKLTGSDCTVWVNRGDGHGLGTGPGAPSDDGAVTVRRDELFAVGQPGDRAQRISARKAAVGCFRLEIP